MGSSTFSGFVAFDFGSFSVLIVLEMTEPSIPPFRSRLIFNLNADISVHIEFFFFFSP
jgi:hypothetical protein